MAEERARSLAVRFVQAAGGEPFRDPESAAVVRLELGILGVSRSVEAVRNWQALREMRSRMERDRRAALVASSTRWAS